MSRRMERVILATIVVAYVAMFARAIGYDYVWDDVHEIAQNPAYDGGLLDGIGATQMERNDPTITDLRDVQLAYDSYRPLLFASFWVDVQLWGKRPGPMHATNLAIGLAAILVAFAVARRVLDAAIPALVSTAIFALHPQQVEAVSYISGRGDLLSGLFALLATYAALRALDGRRAWIAAAAIALVASLACKESCIALPIVVVLIAITRDRARRGALVGAIMLAAGIGYLVFRASVASATSGAALGDAVRALPDIWLAYLRIAIVPFDLSSERVLHHAVGVAGWAIVAVVGAGAIYGVVRRRATTGTAVVGLAWLVLLVGPAAVAIQMTGVIADRYMYVPMFGFAVLVVALGRMAIAARPEARRVLAVVGALWGLLLVIVGWREVPTWTDNLALYEHAVAMEPESSEAQYRLAYLDVVANRWDRALPRLQLAVELDDHNTRALNNLGVGLLRIHEYADAEPVLAKAVAQNPAYFRSWFNLGIVRIDLGRKADGCRDIAHALAINPGYAAARAEHDRSCIVHP